MVYISSVDCDNVALTLLVDLRINSDTSPVISSEKSLSLLQDDEVMSFHLNSIPFYNPEDYKNFSLLKIFRLLGS